ncbi:DUF2169 family type VI secretion system accessory protein [Parachitinimonas caeni]|uniref:DUF2169 domain-containing protein n=1 Tax=Parachitinimonas caeni TaxID=3031301 RepID=A0ABT7E688_9NEIS|nr:DUF2169 domain-containing protein [Parachitinimonas caeni]MDK2126970.1 DUF2169 domain-containing protein [Parachitinimonas caeni]
MQTLNFTPHPALVFDVLDQHQQEFHVAVLRASYRIGDDGTLEPTAEQGPLCVEDEYWGEMNRSSIRQESDLAPHKPKTDIIVLADAYAPEGEPLRQWQVGLQIGSHRKILNVTGPREWRRGLMGGYSLSEPEKIDRLALRYEWAWGGENRIDAAEPNLPPLLHEACMSNPVGRGFAHEDWLRQNKPEVIAAPQIESPDDPIREFGKAYAAQGFGLITRAWQPRLALAGTYDEAWLEKHWPHLPQDHDFAFWNSAHPDLQVPYLKGDETVVLAHLTPEGRLQCQLPAMAPLVFVRYADQPAESLIPVLDTLIIDTYQREVVCVWRTSFPTQPEVDHVAIHMADRRLVPGAAA